MVFVPHNNLIRADKIKLRMYNFLTFHSLKQWLCYYANLQPFTFHEKIDGFNYRYIFFLNEGGSFKNEKLAIGIKIKRSLLKQKKILPWPEVIYKDWSYRSFCMSAASRLVVSGD